MHTDPDCGSWNRGSAEPGLICRRRSGPPGPRPPPAEPPERPRAAPGPRGRSRGYADKLRPLDAGAGAGRRACPGLPAPRRRGRDGAPVDVRFPLASDGMHYPTFDLATQQVVYRFDPVETVAADWVGRGFSPETWERIRQAEAAWRRSDAAKRAWVTIRRRRAEAAKRLSNGPEIPPSPTYRPAPNDGSTEPYSAPMEHFQPHPAHRRTGNRGGSVLKSLRSKASVVRKGTMLTTVENRQRRQRPYAAHTMIPAR